MARSSITGAIPRHGAHQAAQTSSSTGKGEPSTSSSKRASLASSTSEAVVSDALHRPQTACRPVAAFSWSTRFVAPQRRHAIAAVTRQVWHFLSLNARVC